MFGVIFQILAKCNGYIYKTTPTIRLFWFTKSKKKKLILQTMIHLSDLRIKIWPCKLSRTSQKDSQELMPLIKIYYAFHQKNY